MTMNVAEHRAEKALKRLACDIEPLERDWKAISKLPVVQEVLEAEQATQVAFVDGIIDVIEDCESCWEGKIRRTEGWYRRLIERSPFYSGMEVCRKIFLQKKLDLGERELTRLIVRTASVHGYFQKITFLEALVKVAEGHVSRFGSKGEFRQALIELKASLKANDGKLRNRIEVLLKSSEGTSRKAKEGRVVTEARQKGETFAK